MEADTTGKKSNGRAQVTERGMRYERDDRPLRPEVKKKNETNRGKEPTNEKKFPTLLSSVGLPALRQPALILLFGVLIAGGVVFHDSREGVFVARMADLVDEIVLETYEQYNSGQETLASAAESVVMYLEDRSSTPRDGRLQEEDELSGSQPSVIQETYMSQKYKDGQALEGQMKNPSTAPSGEERKDAGYYRAITAIANGIEQGVETPALQTYQGSQDLLSGTFGFFYGVGGEVIEIAGRLSLVLDEAGKKIGEDIYQARVVLTPDADGVSATASPTEALDAHRRLTQDQTTEGSSDEKPNHSVMAARHFFADSVTEGITVTGERITNGVLALYDTLNTGGRAVSRAYTAYTIAVHSGVAQVIDAYGQVGSGVAEGFSRMWRSARGEW